MNIIKKINVDIVSFELQYMLYDDKKNIHDNYIKF